MKTPGSIKGNLAFELLVGAAAFVFLVSQHFILPLLQVLSQSLFQSTTKKKVGQTYDGGSSRVKKKGEKKAEKLLSKPHFD